MSKLKLVKLLHTIIWLFFNVVIFYILLSVLNKNFDYWFYVSMALIILEALILLAFNNTCPLTLLARKYTASTAPNFDIYLPVWLAKYNKLIYSLILAAILLVYILQRI